MLVRGGPRNLWSPLISLSVLLFFFLGNTATHAFVMSPIRKLFTPSTPPASSPSASSTVSGSPSPGSVRKSLSARFRFPGSRRSKDSSQQATSDDSDQASVSSSMVGFPGSPSIGTRVEDDDDDGMDGMDGDQEAGYGAEQRHRSSLPTTQEVLATFPARDFQPAPWITNEHWQTIWGARAVQDIVLQKVAPEKLPQGWQDVYDRRERWETPDGDFFHVDFLLCNARPPAPSSAPRPLAIVLHGLESTSWALLPRSMAKAYVRRGFDVLALNFRGCCGVDNLKPYSYHLGFTDDLAYVLRRLHAEDPRRRVYLTGFSLGGNVILKCLGELGEEAVRLGVEGAAVACVPFDAVRSSSKIDTGFNRWVYAGNFLKTLKVKAAAKWEKHRKSLDGEELGEGPYDLERVLACSRIGDFDDEVIAKLHNFEGKVDYYTQSCSKQYLPRIRIPALVVNARDDPFINEMGLPTPEEVGEGTVRLVYHKHGGHCGFLTGQEEKGGLEEERWLPTELARFLEHVDVYFRALEGDEENNVVVRAVTGESQFTFATK